MGARGENWVADTLGGKYLSTINRKGTCTEPPVAGIKYWAYVRELGLVFTTPLPELIIGSRVEESKSSLPWSYWEGGLEEAAGVV